MHRRMDWSAYDFQITQDVVGLHLVLVMDQLIRSKHPPEASLHYLSVLKHCASCAIDIDNSAGSIAP